MHLVQRRPEQMLIAGSECRQRLLSIPKFDIAQVSVRPHSDVEGEEAADADSDPCAVERGPNLDRDRIPRRGLGDRECGSPCLLGRAVGHRQAECVGEDC